jgi:hypothetical protein
MERLDAPQSTKILLLLTMLGLLGMLCCHPAAAQGRGGVLRIGMTAADIPYTGGQPDQGFEGFRFIGYQLYDPLVRWVCPRENGSRASCQPSPSRGR